MTSGPVVSAARSDVGCVRKVNEDAVLASDPIFAVADGMGGHAAGDVAAAIVLERLAGLAGLDALRSEDVLDCVVRGNADVVRRGVDDPAAAGLGATLAGVCLGDVDGSPHWFVFNVGDARVYRFVDGDVQQMTVDHSEVQELVEAGTITKEQARLHPHRNIVTRSIGTEPAAAVDMWVVPAEPGDRFLICSDGLTGELQDAELAAVLRDAATPTHAVDELIERARARGARDNVSAVVVDLPGVDDAGAAQVTAPRARLNGAPYA